MKDPIIPSEVPENIQAINFKKRPNRFNSKQKATMVLEHIQNKMSLTAISTKYDVSTSYISHLVKKFQQDAFKVFEDVNTSSPTKPLEEELDATKIALAESQTALSILKKKSGLLR